jgi:hypothetical protein
VTPDTLAPLDARGDSCVSYVRFLDADCASRITEMGAKPPISVAGRFCPLSHQHQAC